MAIAVGLAVRAPSGEHRIARAGALLGEAVRDAAALVRRGDPRLLGAFAWWGFDIAVLWAVFHAVGSPPPFGVLVLGYFIGQVANTIPIPGAASGGLAGVLLAFGVAPDLALAGVLAYRSIAIWLPAPFGAHALAGLRRDAARWTAEDAPAATPAPRVRVARPMAAAHAPQPLAA
jgi:multisubunit Na+/H+ antiporter MnhG subunit